MAREFDIIIGIHSIAMAIKSGRRQCFKLYATHDGIKELMSKGGLSKNEINGLSQKLCRDNNELTKEATRLFKEMNLSFTRFPSQVFLMSEPLETKDVSWLFEQADKRDEMKIICLDQVSDVQNGAAILRTAAFFGVNVLVIPQKGNFGITPAFYRTASGATECVDIVCVGNLSRFVRTLDEKGFHVIGMSEHAEKSLNEVDISNSKKRCLVMGAEDVGLSNAVSRSIKEIVALKPLGEIKSLNVSVATAIAMEKVFS